MAARFSHIARLAAMVAAAGLFAAKAESQTVASLPTATTPTESVGETRPVQAWLKFCNEQPEECIVDPDEPGTVTLTRQVWQRIVAVNAKVNAGIRPLTDEDHWGTPDVWSLPSDGYGDCEDYQLLKRKLLVEAGLPRRALRMTVVIDEKGEGHAVLMARTDRGDFILDNKVQSVLPWHQTGYVFVKREGQDGPTWASLGGMTQPATTANR
jgi:predicted transglutaminase-like cysteine proteinase